MVLVIAAAGLWVAVTFIYTPLSNLWSARQTQIRELADKVKSGNSLIKLETDRRRTWGNMSANALPANTSLAQQQLIKAFANWANAAGVELNTINPQWKNDSTNYMTLNCHVEASGTLGPLSQFLYSVEQGSMALRLDSLELSARDKEGQQMTLSTEINGLALSTQEKK